MSIQPIIQRIDNTDSSVSTSGTWVTSRLDEAYEGNMLVATGGGATLTMPFSGTSVMIYGYIPPAGVFEQAPISNYFIDGVQRGRYVASPQAQAQYRVQFFHSPSMPYGQHTLEIRTEASSQTIFGFDYMDIVKNGREEISTSTTSTTSTSTSTITRSTSSSTSESTASSATATSGTSTRSVESSTTTATSSGALTSAAGALAPSQPSDISPWDEDAGNPNDPSNASGGKISGGIQMVGGPDGISLAALLGIIIGVFMVAVLVILFVLLRKRKHRARSRVWYTGEEVEALPTVAPGTVDPTPLSSQVHLVAGLPQSSATSESEHQYGVASEKNRLGFESDVSIHHSHVNEAPTSTIAPSFTSSDSATSEGVLHQYRESWLPPPAYDPSPVTHAQISEDQLQVVLGRLETSQHPRPPNS
ncbi:hypothetical protein FA13DRAFT_266282 [Coprinellus micaceus]|uniref:Uncharacterized protein n=1 Tax=Coprinellus micaceus TaxID=71717 RepID=A0A4Y7SGE0_COPMI|nr:hypothetical protein FA13DRAFT_266282 [Coprinellus micaceus]